MNNAGTQGEAPEVTQEIAVGEESPGELLGGRYRLLERLGTGGMATVWRADDVVLGRHVAVKRPTPACLADPDCVERFQREARAAAALEHPNVVAIHDRGETAAGEPYIVMELVRGRGLHDIIDEHAPIDPYEAVRFVLPVLAALRAAHQHGLVHRDIKPRNIVVGPDGVTKVLDFGIASSSQTPTASTTVLGTASYMSPEQARGAGASPRSDLYAVGSILYELLTGRPPFTGDSPANVALQQVHEHPVPPSRLEPPVPEALDAVVLRALAKDPGDRYADAAAMARALEAALPSEGRLLPANVSPPPPPTGLARGPVVVLEPPPRRWPFIAALLLLAIVAGLVAAFLWQDRSGNGANRTTSGTTRTSTKAAGGSATAHVARVPTQLVGSPSADAAARVRAAGLRVRRLRVFAGEPVGRVVASVPAPGTRLVRNQLVTLKISKGALPIPVPDVAGQDPTGAAAALRRAGFVVRVIRQHAPVAAGLVSETRPAAGAKAPKQATVIVVVSLGSLARPVPDVSARSVSAAQATLRGAGFIPGTISYQPDASAPRDQVLATMPPAGTHLAKGETVDLTLSSGPPQVVVPGVRGMDLQAARRRLETAGFQIDRGAWIASDKAGDGIVLAQTPAAGSVRTQGVTVILRLGRWIGRDATTTPGVTQPPPATTGPPPPATDTTATAPPPPAAATSTIP